MTADDDAGQDAGRLSLAFAGLVVRLRYVVVVFWIAVAVLSIVALPSIEEAPSGSLGDLVASDTEAAATEQRSFELFSFPVLSRTILVQRRPQGLSPAAQADVIGRAARIATGGYPRFRNILFALAVTNALGQPPFSREQSTTALTYLFFPPDIGRLGRTGLTDLFAKTELDPDRDAPVGVTGAVPARAAQIDAIKDALPLIDIATVLLVLIAVGLHFRAVGAPLVNLATVAVAFIVASRATSGLGETIGIRVPGEVEPVVLVLLFGIITDYSIFFLSRFRRMLAEHEDAHSAAVRATAELLPIILVAGLTVVAASTSLVVARLGFFQSFGPAIGLAVLLSLMVAVTLVPALLAIGGRRVFWPRVPERPVYGPAPATQAAGRRLRDRILTLAVDKPVKVAVAVTLALLVMASGLARLEVGNPLVRGLPADSEARLAYEEASKGFAPGILSPTLVLVEGDGIVDRRGALRRLQRTLGEVPGVATVIGPGDQPAALELGAAVSQDGNAARYAVILSADPLGGAAIRAVRHLRTRLPELLIDAGLTRATATIGGDTAISEETVTKSGEDLNRIAPAVLLTAFLLLALLLRALIAPLYLLAASVLGLAASLGLTVIIVQDIFGHAEMVFFVPFIASVLLVALGSDYNVFLTGRVWFEGRVLPLREAILVGAGRASGAISAAAIVLALSFALLALVPLQAFRELAIAMFIGLLIDAFVVRALLVPALIALVGERGAWPGGGLRPAPAIGYAARAQPTIEAGHQEDR